MNLFCRLLAGIALTVPLSAQALTGKESLSRFLDGLNTLEARFEQSVLDTENQRTGVFHGIFLLKRPGQFRWDYVAPEEQMIVADGRDIWIADKGLQQITQQSQAGALKGTPARLLLEDFPLENEFEVIEIGDRQGLIWLELIPRDEDSQFIRVQLAFADGELRRMEMRDKFGQISRFRFFEIKRNPALDPDIFDFQPPPGWDLFHH